MTEWSFGKQPFNQGAFIEPTHPKWLKRATVWKAGSWGMAPQANDVYRRIGLIASSQHGIAVMLGDIIILSFITITGRRFYVTRPLAKLERFMFQVTHRNLATTGDVDWRWAIESTSAAE